MEFSFPVQEVGKNYTLLFFLLGNSDIGSDATLLAIFAMFIFLFSLGFCFISNLIFSMLSATFGYFLKMRVDDDDDDEDR